MTIYIYIYICGGCTVFGVGADDKRTIASYLQYMLNKSFPDRKYIVQNYGYFLCEGDQQSDEHLAIMESLPVRPGDIVICSELGQVDGVPFIDMSDAANFPRSYEVFFDSSGHLTPDGNRLIADRLLQGLVGLESGFSENKSRGTQNSYGFDSTENAELDAYKNILTEYYNAKFNTVIGSVVMNCNPFTLGHRHLIEQALRQCDFLIIFVVEEDKSMFSFDDRLRLVDLGVADLPNVEVIPSGRFVLSSLTFSEYFNKSEMQDRVIDTSLDITLFAKEIAPCLHISKRFAGEEPLDRVTHMYNETMRGILPQYGIEFIEIPRKTLSGEPISASRVRSLLNTGELEEIKSLVPESTYEYLCSIFTEREKDEKNVQNNDS
ncbi:MAG: adenylyltransferase/cytidyltransferase family protein [Bacteroides sp.]|nr:adenylyltransferase/cytidyltransferase family protein [Bacteroides sp.]